MACDSHVITAGPALWSLDARPCGLRHSLDAFPLGATRYAGRLHHPRDLEGYGPNSFAHRMNRFCRRRRGIHRRNRRPHLQPWRRVIWRGASFTRIAPDITRAIQHQGQGHSQWPRICCGKPAVHPIPQELSSRDDGARLEGRIVHQLIVMTCKLTMSTQSIMDEE